MEYKKCIDLTFPIYQGMLTFPSLWHPQVEITKLGRHKIEGRETRKIVLGTHTGTHIDAPLHFIPKGRSIEKIPLEVCIGPGVLISFRNKKEISSQDLKKKLQRFRNLKRLIVRFDWSEQFGTPSYYKNYPYFSKESCQWLVEKGVKLLGMDTPSPDKPKNKEDSPNHKFFMKNNVVLVEYLCNLRKLRRANIFLIALPLKILGADGAPARAVAWEI